MQKLRKALSVSLAVGVLATACSVFSAPAAADGGQVTTPYFHGLDENTDGLIGTGFFENAQISTEDKKEGSGSLKAVGNGWSTLTVKNIAVTPGKTYFAAVSIKAATVDGGRWIGLDIRPTGVGVWDEGHLTENDSWFTVDLNAIQAQGRFVETGVAFTVPEGVTSIDYEILTADDDNVNTLDGELWFDNIVLTEVPAGDPGDLLSGSLKPGYGYVNRNLGAIKANEWATWSQDALADVSRAVTLEDGEPTFVLDNSYSQAASPMSKLQVKLDGLTEGAWYKLTGYVKTQGVSAASDPSMGVYVQIGNVADMGNAPSTDVKKTLPVTTDVDWTPFELVWQYNKVESAEEGKVYEPHIMLFNWPGRGTAWFAGLSLTETEDPAAQVENPPSLDMEKETVAETGLELTGSFAQAAFNTGVKYSGEKSLKLESTGDNSLTYPDVKVTPGSTVVFGAYLRFESIIPNPSDGAWMSMFLVDSATGETIKEYSNVGFANSIQSLNGGFAEHRIKAEIPEGVEKVDLVIRTGGGGSFEFWLDDMNLITLPEESTDKDNLLDYNIMPEYSDMLSCSSPAMANMNTVHWESWVEPQSAIITTDRLVKKDGEYSFKFDTSKGNFLGENTHARLYVTAGGLEAGETYTLSAYVKTQGLQPADGGFQLIFDTLPGNDLNGFEPGRLAATDLISGDNDWTYVETTFVYNPQEGAVPTICLSSFNTKGVAWVDGICLVKGEGSGEGPGEDDDITDTGVGVTGAAAVLLAAALPVSVITLRSRKKKA